MVYKLEFTEIADKQLRKLDRQIAIRIESWLELRINGCSNPRLWGIPLSGDKSEMWRYRVGEYRILCEIKDHILIVKAVRIAHRRQVYD